jgi:TonB family protein
MSLLVENAVKVSLILATALAAVAIFRHRSAALRHWMLSTALVCAVLAPAFRPIAPSWSVTLDPTTSVSQVLAGLPQTPGAAPSASRPSPAVPSATASPVDWGRVASWTWITGAALSLLVLAVGFARLAWIAARSAPITTGPWAGIAADLCRQSALRRRVRLLQSDQSTLLVTWGVFQPDIILPRGVLSWSDDRIRVVLLHELAHISRGDWATQIVAECLRSVYWFNPFVWLATARLRKESEHACDDAVLAGGVDAPDYATHLLDVARAIKGRHPLLPAPAMARPSSLERRFTAMLNNATNRSPLTRPARAGASIAVLIASILIAGYGAAQTFSTFSGSVFDSTNRVVPQITVVLINTQSEAKYSIKSDRNGRFEFVGLPPGEYTFEASAPGFATLKGKMTVAGRDVQKDLSLEVGSLEETITIRASTSDPADANPKPRRVESPKAREPRVPPQCDGTGVGGNIKAPRKLVDVRPDYPENLRASGVGGVVILSALIGTDGNIRNVDVVSAPYPDLGVAAMDAVRQWEFSQTLLNCEPIEVKMKVTANFQIQQ